MGTQADCASFDDKQESSRDMGPVIGGEAVVQSLIREGVEMVFGLPGVQIMPIYDAFYNNPGIRIMTVRHEQTAAYMADGYARVTGMPGVALVAPGPGVQNASAALGTAYASSSPLLLLTGQIKRSEIGRGYGALHEINDQLDIVRPVTKWCQRVTDFGEISNAINEAMRQMRSGRPRPTEVEIPPDVLDMTGVLHFAGRASVKRKKPDPHEVRRAAQLLKGASKPFIWAGGGVQLADASEDLVALAETFGAPVATTPEGKGSIPEDHPLSLGSCYYGHGASSWAAPESDVILAVGTRMYEQLKGLNKPQKPQKLVQLDVDSKVIGSRYPAEVGIECDARAGLQALLKEIGRDKLPIRWTEEELEELRVKQNRWLEKHASPQCKIIRSIQESLADDAIIVSGVNNIAYWSYFSYIVRRPRSYITPSYFATLGFSFPTALGAKVGAPERSVICLVGDGGLMYALPDLATAVKYNINVVVVVFVDNAFGASKDDQRTRYHGRMVGTDLNNPNFAEVARLFGAYGKTVEPDRIGNALSEAIEQKKPAVIEVPIPTWTPPFQIAPRQQ
jgi:acetolactate synthase-1/2/3 large subunit